MAKINREVASKDVYGWLDSKKIMESTKESNEDSIELLIDAVVEGIVVIDDKTFLMTHNLQFPIGEDKAVKSLTYKNRINDFNLEPCMKGVKPTDSQGMMRAYIQALSGQSKSILKGLDQGTDKKISQAVVIFFL